MKRSVLVLSLALLATGGYAGTPAAAAQKSPQVTNFGSGTASRDDIIEALSQPKMRGVAPAETKPKAVSFETKFEFNSAQLTEQAKQQLTALGEALSSDELKAQSFVIEGHTDAVGSEAYNKDLSERRASAVKNFLVGGFNVDPSRLETVGKGKSELLDPANPRSGVNRRVQVVNKAE